MSTRRWGWGGFSERKSELEERDPGHVEVMPSSGSAVLEAIDRGVTPDARAVAHGLFDDFEAARPRRAED